MVIGNLKKTAVRSAGINVISNSIGFIFQTVGVIVLARLLTPKDFGLVAMVTAFSMWIMNFGINGFTEYIIQKKDIDTLEINSIFWTHLFLASLLSVCFILFGFFLVYFYKEPALSGISAVMASSFILYALFTCHFAVLKREMKFTYIASAQLIAVILSIGLSISAAVIGLGYWAVVIRQLTLPIITVIAAWIIRPWRPQRPQNLLNALPALKYAIKVYSNFSLSYLSRNIDNVLLGKFHGSTVLGNYDRAYYLSQQPIAQLLQPLTSVALATLSRIRQDKIKFAAYYIKVVSTISFIGMAVTISFMLTAQDLVLLLLGPAWTETGKILMALIPALAATLISGTNSWLYLSLGQPGRWFRWNIIATSFTILAFIIAAPFGAVAMGIAYSTKAYILLLPGLWYAGRPIQLSPKILLNSIWPYHSSAVIIAAFWLYISTHWMPLSIFLSELHIIIRVALVASTATFLYISLVVLFERSFKSVYDFIALVKLFFKRGDA